MAGPSGPFAATSAGAKHPAGAASRSATGPSPDLPENGNDAWLPDDMMGFGGMGGMGAWEASAAA